MAIWARRVVQQMLGDMAEIAPRPALEETVRQLNRAGQQSLHAEWELASLWALSRVFPVSYKPHIGSRNPDFEVFLEVCQGEGFQITGDVTTASDRAAEEANPVWPFVREVNRRTAKRKQSAGFQYSIGGDMTGGPRSRRMTLKIPHERDFEGDFGSALDCFLDEVAKGGSREFRYQTGDIEVALSFGSGPGGTHPSFTTPYSNTANPIWTALIAKANQLRQTGARGPTVVLLCDAGCSFLSNRASPTQRVTLDSIIRNFFRQRRSVSVVLTLSAVRPWPGVAAGPWPPPELQVKTFSNPRARYPLNEQALARFLEFVKVLPAPVDDSRNAYLRVNDSRQGRGLTKYGEWTLTEDMLTISLSGLYRLLAGALDQATFLRDHWDANENPFARQLRLGKGIIEVSIQENEGEDDDWVTFRFGERDTAIAPFVVPARTRNEKP